MDDPSPEAATFEPWKHIGDAIYRRRYELFVLAAPVFREHGYRGATIRALAHACHLSPAGLYHYFGSKEQLATYPLWAPRMRWETTWLDPGADPLEQVRDLIDSGIRNVPLYLLAIRLHEEIHGPSDARTRAATFREGEDVFGRMIHAAHPGLTREDATDLGRHLVATLVGSAFSGLDPDERAIRRRMVELLRLRLVPDAVAASRFDRVMRADRPSGR